MKIAIITQYYNSYNYGGVLQAYALTTILENMGHDVKQIAFDKSIKGVKAKIKYHLIYDTPQDILRLLKTVLREKQNRKLKNQNVSPVKEQIQERKKKFYEFRNAIPHTEIYDSTNVKLLNGMFDVFITGSDQVWNPSIWCEAYFLSFVQNKNTIAYAASIGVHEIPVKKIAVFTQGISHIRNISVREIRAAQLVEKFSCRSAEVVLDPTLLLDQHKWEKIETSTSGIPLRYTLCYLLGTHKDQYELAQKVCGLLELPVVFIPFGDMSANQKVEKEIGDIRLYDVGPREFVWLIHHADYVITDSFHGCVFSVIFQKNFWILNRLDAYGLETMMERVYTLIDMLHLGDRLISFKTDLNALVLHKDIEYLKTPKILEKERNASIQFLEKALAASMF